MLCHLLKGQIFCSLEALQLILPLISSASNSFFCFRQTHFAIWTNTSLQFCGEVEIPKNLNILTVAEATIQFLFSATSRCMIWNTTDSSLGVWIFHPLAQTAEVIVNWNVGLSVNVSFVFDISLHNKCRQKCQECCEQCQLQLCWRWNLKPPCQGVTGGWAPSQVAT